MAAYELQLLNRVDLEHQGQQLTWERWIVAERERRSGDDFHALCHLFDFQAWDMCSLSYFVRIARLNYGWSLELASPWFAAPPQS
jgi:hypothetical protein